jgi:hypothetical protein
MAGDRPTHLFATPATDTALWKRFLASASHMTARLVIPLAAVAFAIAFWFQIHFDIAREDQGWMFGIVFVVALIVLLHLVALVHALLRRP